VKAGRVYVTGAQKEHRSFPRVFELPCGSGGRCKAGLGGGYNTGFWPPGEKAEGLSMRRPTAECQDLRGCVFSVVRRGSEIPLPTGYRGSSPRCPSQNKNFAPRWGWIGSFPPRPALAGRSWPAMVPGRLWNRWRRSLTILLSFPSGQICRQVATDLSKGFAVQYCLSFVASSMESYGLRA
jgi:hypothetical protein